MENVYTLQTLPEAIASEFLKVRTAKAIEAHRKAVQAYKGVTDLFTAGQQAQPTVGYCEKRAIWATDNYETLGKAYGALKPVHKLEVITPRIEKSKTIQKQRTKEKAEVFTPSWVCNLQNNLVDDETVYPGAFNTVATNSIEAQKTWVPNPKPVFDKDSEAGLKAAVEYIMSRRLEATCGEAPYLVSRYDTVSGDFIPVVDGNGAYQRIGLLDRKLRIVSEIASDEETWVALALEALKATYGYEWQGDNLLLARLNLLNSFIEYYENFFGGEKAVELMESVPQAPEQEITSTSHLLLQVAHTISWNIWQMDGLKMVIPMSCITDSEVLTENCSRCEKYGLKNSHDKYVFHNGAVPVIRWGDKIIAFEDFLVTAETSAYRVNKPKAKASSKRQTGEAERYEQDSLFPVAPQ